MTINRQRRKRQRNSRIFHTILLIAIICAVVGGVVLGIRWMKRPVDAQNTMKETGITQPEILHESRQDMGLETSQESSEETTSMAVSSTDTSRDVSARTETGPAASEKENLFIQMAGTWQIDGEMTNRHLEEAGNEYHSLQDMFGTGIQHGSELTIHEDGTIEYYIGITNGGTGQGEIIGDQISVKITPYEEHSDVDEILTIGQETSQNKIYLVLDYYGEKLYWTR